MATELLLVRHGQSVANVVSDAAHAAGDLEIDLDTRDADVDLTALGVTQARSLGHRLRDLQDHQHEPQVVWCSPFARARKTWDHAATTSELAIPVRVDERLRDRDLGVLDRLTTHGINERFPAEFRRQHHLGKFYYRPPGGESWTDVALRVRSVLTDIDRLCRDQRVLVVAHDAVLLTFRYVCEQLSEADVLHISQATTVAHAALTHLSAPCFPGDPWTLKSFNSATDMRSTEDGR